MLAISKIGHICQKRYIGYVLTSFPVPHHHGFGGEEEERGSKVKATSGHSVVRPRSKANAYALLDFHTAILF